MGSAAEMNGRSSTDSSESVAIEDLVGKDESSGASFFDESEFRIRAGIEDEHYWHLHRREVLLETLRRFLGPDPGRLIECGCGIGTVTTFLNENGYTVDYSDVFTEALKVARERAEDRLGTSVADRRFLRLDITSPMPKLEHQGLLLLDVLEHLPNDEAVLGHIYEALPSGSHLIMTVPAFNFLWSPWDDVEKHRRRYSRGHLRRVVSRAGFQTRHLEFFFTPLFFAALGVKTLRKMREAVAGPPAPGSITELTEGKNNAAVNTVMRSVLKANRKVLGPLSPPVGTSLLLVAERP